MSAFDPFDAEVRRDPYPQWAELREREPLHRSARNAWVATRYDDVARLLADERMSHWMLPGAAANPSNDFERIVGRWLHLMNPASRSRLRALTARLFSPAKLAEAEAAIEARAERLLDGGVCDIVRDYAEPLTMSMIAVQFGVPEAMRAEFIARAGAIRGSLFRALMGAPAGPDGDAFVALLGELFQRKQHERGGDLLAAFFDAQSADALDRDDFVALALVFLFAGQENITNCIANAVAALLAHPAQLDALRRGAVPMAQAVEELMRFESPVQYVNLTVRAPMEVRERMLQPGEQVLACVGAANRDPRVFADPDTLDLGRAPNPHLAFGCGAFFCIGATLARLEARIALDVLLRRSRAIEPAGAPLWRDAPAVLRGVASLPVTIQREVYV